MSTVTTGKMPVKPIPRADGIAGRILSAISRVLGRKPPLRSIAEQNGYDSTDDTYDAHDGTWRALRVGDLVEVGTTGRRVGQVVDLAGDMPVVSPLYDFNSCDYFPAGVRIIVAPDDMRLLPAPPLPLPLHEANVDDARDFFPPDGQPVIGGAGLFSGDMGRCRLILCDEPIIVDGDAVLAYLAGDEDGATLYIFNDPECLADLVLLALDAGVNIGRRTFWTYPARAPGHDDGRR